MSNARVRRLTVAGMVALGLSLGGCQTTETGSDANNWASELARAVNAACGVLPPILELLKLYAGFKNEGIDTVVALVCSAANREKASIAARPTVAEPTVARRRTLPVGTVITFTVQGKRISATISR
jgi:hypothetical protein